MKSDMSSHGTMHAILCIALYCILIHIMDAGHPVIMEAGHPVMPGQNKHGIAREQAATPFPTAVDVLIVGAGLSGARAIIAQQYAEHFPHLKILVIDKRHHIGGNCYDYVEEDTGIRVNLYHQWNTLVPHEWRQSVELHQSFH